MADSKKVEVTVEQVQQAEPFRLPLEFGIATAGSAPARRVEKVELTGRTQRFEFAVDQEPAAVVLDPETRTLAELAMTRRQ